jgi:hypothetical protein
MSSLIDQSNSLFNRLIMTLVDWGTDQKELKSIFFCLFYKSFIIFRTEIHVSIKCYLFRTCSRPLNPSYWEAMSSSIGLKQDIKIDKWSPYSTSLSLATSSKNRFLYEINFSKWHSCLQPRPYSFFIATLTSLLFIF